MPHLGLTPASPVGIIHAPSARGSPGPAVPLRQRNILVQ